ncbi:MAG: PQQ-binding-like beta-propeller repeat protein, partial [Roseibacillus sp.]
MSRALVFLLVVFATVRASAADWPMWRYDLERTAESPQQLPNELALLWSRDLPKPLPAFNDVRLQFDGGYEPIVVGQRLFLSSNCEDKVTAFDTNSGAQLWQFFAAGPVRLAPVAWKDRVLFGSDDGNFYCVAADTGKLVWKFKAVPSGRKLLGNERLISVWPIRGGPVLKDDRVYFAAGVWPFEGVFIYCLDAATGKQIWVNDSTGHLYGQQPHNAVAIGGIAPQGYLLIDGDDLVVPSSNAYPGRFDLKTGELKDFKLPLAGRFPGGWYASLAGKTEQKNTKRKSLLADMGINVMRHEDRLRAEGKPEVRTTIRAAEREFRFTKGFPNVTGKIHSMIAADGKLFVSTVAGGLYAFGKSDPRAPRRIVREQPTPPGPTELSSKILAATVRHGYAVFLGAPDAATLTHLATQTELHLVVVDSDANRVEMLRHQLVRSGIYGSRVAVAHADPAAFEMPPYFANTMFVRSGIAVDARHRAFQSVRPYGGKLIVQTASDLQITIREGALPGSTNYNGDFKSSSDELVKAPLGVLWFDDTLAHFKRSPQPKFIDGLMVSTTKDWLDASTREGRVDYRLLPPTFSDVYTGRILTDDETKLLKKQPFAKVDLKTVQPSQYRPPAQRDDWKPKPPVAGYRQNPLTGETEPRVFPKSYGCDGGFDYGNIYTMRSGTAAFYDKRVDSGTINISGPRSGCTNSVIPANGVLNVPYFYKGCTCSYPLPTGLSLYSLPETHEQWTTWGAIARDQLAGKIQRIGINFGAPADRMTESGTLWLDYPSAGGPSPDLEIETVPAKPRSYY